MDSATATPDTGESLRDTAPAASGVITPAGKAGTRRTMRYSLRMFIHTLLIVLSIIGVCMGYMYYRSNQLRSGFHHSQLSLIDRNIIYAYDQKVDLAHYVEFIEQYLENSTLYDRVCISVYDSDGNLVAKAGTPLALNDESAYEVQHEYDDGDSTTRQAVIHVADRDKLFYFSSSKTDDGKLTILTALPYSHNLEKSSTVNNSFWWIMALLVVAATGSVWLSTRWTSRNIKLLRTYSQDAAAGRLLNIDDASLPHDELGEITRVIFSIYNQRIQAIRRSERDHRVAIHAVREQARMEHQMTSNINHELKTPVGVIKGYVDTILDDPDMDEATRKRFLERTRSNIERLCLILEGLSTVSRLEDGADQIPIASLNFHDLAYAVNLDIENSNLLPPGMILELDIPEDCYVMGNENLLGGMLLNLAKNAAIHAHGKRMGLKLIDQSDKFYVFSFWDNGVGVEPAHLSRLFERFYRVDTGRSRKIGGTGLGLAIVKRTVMAHGGAISVNNRSTGGLEFTFSLPKTTDQPK